MNKMNKAVMREPITIPEVSNESVIPSEPAEVNKQEPVNDGPKKAIINWETPVNVRKAPSPTAAVHGYLKKGDTVYVIDAVNSQYSEIRLPSFKDLRLFVMTKYLQIQ